MGYSYRISPSPLPLPPPTTLQDHGFGFVVTCWIIQRRRRLHASPKNSAKPERPFMNKTRKCACDTRDVLRYIIISNILRYIIIIISNKRVEGHCRGTGDTSNLSCVDGVNNIIKNTTMTKKILTHPQPWRRRRPGKRPRQRYGHTNHRWSESFLTAFT